MSEIRLSMGEQPEVVKRVDRYAVACDHCELEGEVKLTNAADPNYAKGKPLTCPNCGGEMIVGDRIE